MPGSTRRDGSSWSALGLVTVTSLGLLTARPAAAADCTALTKLTLPDVSITAATPTPASFTYPGEAAGAAAVGVAFCRVQAVATPGDSSGIHFEVWLPTARTWNGKFRGEGSGGSAGALSYAAMVDAVDRNYATMSQDNGHTGSSWTFSQNPGSVIDFGYRAEHVTTVAAKAITAAYYGSAPKHSYFVGCSQGGHHAQMEVQRYPDDYDGVIAGAAASDWTDLMVNEVWVGYNSSVKGAAYDLPQVQLDLLNTAVVARCGRQADGLATNGWLNEPRACHYDPADLQCTVGQDPSTCLTADQVQAARAIYGGAVDPVTGKRIAQSLQRGSEPGWREFLVGGTQPGGSSLSYFRDGVFDDDSYNFQNFDFHADTLLANGKTFDGQTLVQILDAVNPDIEPFRKRGGKLIMYHGWADPFVSPLFSVDLYKFIVADQARRADLSDSDGLRATEDFARLFMVPGMQHCAGGPGANTFGGVGQAVVPSLQDTKHDLVRALEHWVEDGVAPSTLIATKFNGDVPTQGVAFTRPLCPYPNLAAYDGKGSTADALNFSCVSGPTEHDGRAAAQQVAGAAAAARQ